MIQAETLHTVDSIAPAVSDSLAQTAVPMLEVSPLSTAPPPTQRRSDSIIGSGLLLLVLAVFCMVCARFKSNWNYLHTLLQDLTSVRERGNVFDDTVKETTYMVMLNLLCAVTTGLSIFVGGGLADPALQTEHFAWSAIAAAMIYGAAMPLAYLVTGNVFSDALHTRMWTRGFFASQALLGQVLLIPALVSIFYPKAAFVLCIFSALGFIIIKLTFIFKGFRIFFAQISSWLLFLYYLCILEIIPLGLTVWIALKFSGYYTA